MKLTGWIVAGLGAVCTQGLAQGGSGELAGYTRVHSEPGSTVVTLEMCERAFVPISGDGPTIHLVSAIHIADQSFYQAMQALLEGFDVVLYEGVKPAGFDSIDPGLSDQAKADATSDRLALLLDIADQYYATHGRLPRSVDELADGSEPTIASIVRSIEDDGWGEPIVTKYQATAVMGEMTECSITFLSRGADRAFGGEGLGADIERQSSNYVPGRARAQSPEGIQSQMARALRVAFQLDEMNMVGKGWINADIDITELQAQLAELGEDNAMLLTLLDGSSLQAKLIGFVLRFVERSPTMSSMMKLALMDMLALVESADVMGQFEAIEKVILNGRNRVVLDYLAQAIEEHAQADSIGVFYGAAHMPGIEEVIMNQMGYKFAGDTWHQAMRVDTKDTGLADGQIKMMRSMIRQSLEKQF